MERRGDLDGDWIIKARPSDICTPSEHARCGRDSLNGGFADPNNCSTCKCRPGYSGPKCAFDSGKSRVIRGQSHPTMCPPGQDTDIVLSESVPIARLVGPMIKVGQTVGSCVYRVHVGLGGLNGRRNST